MSYGETVERIVSAIQRGDAQSYAEFFTESAVLEHPLAPKPLKGRDAIRESEQAIFDSFSDIQIDIRSLTHSGQHVVAEVVLRATNTGPMDFGEAEPLPATEQRIEIAAVWVFEFAPSGHVASERDYFDTAKLMAQLGIEL